MDDTYPWADWPLKVIELLNRRPASGKFPALNAVRHIDMAWKIKDIDREMTGFRCITAIEEATTAIFQALKHRNYDDADRFLKTNHSHKWSLVPFIYLIIEAFKNLNRENDDITVGVEWRERVEVFEGENMKVIADRLWVKVEDRHTGAKVHPIPPFGSAMMKDGQLDDFVSQIDALVKKQSVESVAAMIHKFANQRNHLLYATKSKIPTLRDDVDVKRNVDGSARQVMQLLTAYLLIDQWNEKQPLVQQIVNATVNLVPQLRSNPKRPTDDQPDCVI